MRPIYRENSARPEPHSIKRSVRVKRSWCSSRPMRLACCRACFTFVMASIRSSKTAWCLVSETTADFDSVTRLAISNTPKTVSRSRRRNSVDRVPSSSSSTLFSFSSLARPMLWFFEYHAGTTSAGLDVHFFTCESRSYRKMVWFGSSGHGILLSVLEWNAQKGSVAVYLSNLHTRCFVSSQCVHLIPIRSLSLFLIVIVYIFVS